MARMVTSAEVNAITFVQSHDVGSPPNRRLAQAFIAAYPGYPVFFDVHLRYAALNNLVWVQNTLAAGPHVNLYSDGDTSIFTPRRLPPRRVLTETAMIVADKLGSKLSRARAAFFSELLPSWKPIADTNAALTRLSRELRTGILSNLDDDIPDW